MNNSTQQIAGYFSLAFKELQITQECRSNITNANRRTLFGRANPTSIRVILLAQLGKDDNEGGSLKLDEILSMASAYARDAQKLIGGKLLLVECEDCDVSASCADPKKLACLYEKHGFTYVQKSPDSRLHQLVILI